jgi:hypothetical protein
VDGNSGETRRSENVKATHELTPRATFFRGITLVVYRLHYSAKREGSINLKLNACPIKAVGYEAAT